MPLIIDETYRVPHNDGAPTFDADPVLNIDNLTLQQLLTLRNEVEKRLPVKNLRKSTSRVSLFCSFKATRSSKTGACRTPKSLQTSWRR